MTDKLGWKTCSECRRELLATKFYCHPGEPDGLMAHCKACHNGCIDLNDRVRPQSTERTWGDPAESDIVAATARIQSQWDAKTRKRRKSMAWLARRLQGAVREEEP